MEVLAKRFCQRGVAIAMAASSVVCLLHQPGPRERFGKQKKKKSALKRKSREFRMENSTFCKFKYTQQFPNQVFHLCSKNKIFFWDAFRVWLRIMT